MIVEWQHPIHHVLEAAVLTSHCRVWRPVKTKPRACISLIISNVYVHPKRRKLGRGKVFYIVITIAIERRKVSYISNISTKHMSLGGLILAVEA